MITVKELIDVLQKEVAEEDREIAEIEFFLEDENDENEYEIAHMSGFNMSPDIVVRLKKIEGGPIEIKPMAFKHSMQAEKQEMEAIIETIKKENA